MTDFTVRVFKHLVFTNITITEISFYQDKFIKRQTQCRVYQFMLHNILELFNKMMKIAASVIKQEVTTN